MNKKSSGTHLTQIIISLFLLFCFQNSNAGGINGAEDKVKLFNARQNFLAGNYKSALNLYKEVYKNKPEDAELAFRIGECELEMDSIDRALEYLEKAQSLNYAEPALYLNLGKAYHINARLDKALEAFNTFHSKAGSPEKISESRVDYYIAQCNNAKELMAKPVNVIIENAGQNINSAYDDKTPVLSVDGKTIIFSTRRPAGKLSIVDKEADNKYFDDIYYSYWDENNQAWSEAVAVPGNVNYIESHDACTGISPDGKQMFLYKNEEYITRSGDIFVSQIGPSGKWQTPQSISEEINTPYYEDGACLSPDGNTLYFVSERKGGYGKSDIYMSQRISGSQWDKPVNLGPDVNTPENEAGLFIAADGLTLFFCSQGHNSMGSYDIFKTMNSNGVWSKPVNLGYPVNTTRRDGPITFTQDGKTAYLSSDRKGGIGEIDIYKADFSNDILFKRTEKKEKKDWTGLSTIKGMIIDLQAGQAVETEIVVMDEYGQRITVINSNNDGEYSVTLPGDKKYELKIETKQHKPVKEKVFLPVEKEGTYTLVKDINLHRK